MLTLFKEETYQMMDALELYFVLDVSTIFYIRFALINTM